VATLVTPASSMFCKAAVVDIRSKLWELKWLKITKMTFKVIESHAYWTIGVV